MNTRHAFALHPLSASLKWISLLPFLLVGTHATARILDNESAVITGNVAEDSYLLRNNADLTANGATTREIRADTGSKLTLNGTAVTATANPIAVDLVGASATINGSTVTGRSIGLSLGTVASNPVGSSATVTGSVITGGATGALVGHLGQLDLIRTKLTGTTGLGLQISNGQVSASGSEIRGGRNGVLLTPGGTGDAGHLVLDDTHVEGQNLA